MPKLKTHKGTAKRIKITGSGKISRERAYGNHILAKKSKARKRNMKTAAFISGKIKKNVKTALGV
ncbi:50S ribosomal protein L35 [Candidatus Saccharibacteria bacterium]|nr:50S ribosomal protein L35 [Candidatus Saccharibacteria bacterium]MBQ1540192.1 50S ribosomal protein L35 [Candidatus Saccharibacteria bacterium]